MSLTSDIVDLANDFEKMFFEDPYDNTWTLLKSSKNKDSILHRGFYFNHQRDNKKSTAFKCRRIVNKKECTGTFTLNSDGTFQCKDHQWWCDGTFKSSPKFYYQHYLIHGKYNDSWALPAVFSFLSGKSFEMYHLLFTQLKSYRVIITN